MPIRTPEIIITPSDYEGFAVYEIYAEHRQALMETVARITGSFSRVEEFRPHVEKAGHAQLEVANAPANLTIR